MKKIIATILIGIITFISLTPDINAWLQNPFKNSQIVFSADGKPLHWQGPPYRAYVRFSEIPNILVEAVRTTEDHRFFFHEGIDWIAMSRAIKHLIKTGRKDIGASTITMQLARNAFLSSEKTYSRKIKELIFAIKIDAILSKHKIMELYLNRIYLGQGAYGVRASAWRYYGKKLSELTLPEIAMIAGLPQAPSKKNPITNRTQAIKRRNFVLKKLYKHKVISQTEYMHARQSKSTAKLYNWPKNPKYQIISQNQPHIYLPPRKQKYD